MQSIPTPEILAPFIKDIFLISGADEDHVLPFYADGYPGIMFSRTAHEVRLLPLDKVLPDFFLYGQTIEPIELTINGAYEILVFQLYPFATRLLIGIDPKEINDLCFDLGTIDKINTDSTVSLLRATDTSAWVDIVSDYVLELVKASSVKPDHSIKMAVSTIISTKGTLSVQALRDQLFISERTFERRFAKEIGVTPKQFARIVQFNYSLDQLKEADYTSLTNVAYDNGYADHSHFIRSFKRYTGKTPKEILQDIGES